MRPTALLLGLALGAAPGPALAQQSDPPALDGPHRTFRDSLLDRLVGSWTMTGTVRGEHASMTLRAEWVLNHQFLKLDMRDVAEPPEYQATVFIGYDNTSERYVAHWLDAFGGRWSETLGYGHREGAGIRLVFEYPDGPFHNTLSWDAPTGTWSMLATSRGPGGTWREFARYTMRRA